MHLIENSTSVTINREFVCDKIQNKIVQGTICSQQLTGDAMSIF